MRATSLRPGLPAADLRQRRRLPGRLRRPLLRRLRGVQDRGRARRRQVPRSTAPQPEWIEEKNWFFRLSAYQDKLLALYDARPDFVLPGFRYNEARSFIAGGLQDFSISRAGQPWGIPIPWDRIQVAYVWADALVNYLSALTYARPGEDLRERTGRPCGTCSARTSSASTASTGRRCCSRPGYERAAAAVRARLPAPRRPEDLEVARQRRRPARPDRRLRRRPGAVLVRARGLLRAGRQRLARRAPRALRPRARQRPRQPPLADDGDDRALPRRHARGRGRRRLAGEGDPRPARRRCRRRARRLRHHRRARADLGGRPRASTGYVEATAPWQLAKDEARADELDARALRPRRRAPRGRRRAPAVHSGRPRRRSSPRSASRDELDWEQSPTARTVEVAGIEPAEPLFPRIDPPAAAA